MGDGYCKYDTNTNTDLIKLIKIKVIIIYFMLDKFRMLLSIVPVYSLTILFLGLLNLLTMDLSDSRTQGINYHPMDKSSAFLFYQ